MVSLRYAAWLGVINVIEPGNIWQNSQGKHGLHKVGQPLVAHMIIMAE